jgi:hypothetical protein
MVPYSFASTSHFVLTFALSFTIVLGATILGFQKHGLKFFSLLVPAGCPLGLLPLLVLIEFISYLARNVSLGLRLAANIEHRQPTSYPFKNLKNIYQYNVIHRRNYSQATGDQPEVIPVVIYPDTYLNKSIILKDTKNKAGIYR